MTLISTSLSRQGRFMRIVAPVRGLLRQSQNRLPQADPPTFCRRSAPLTPPRRGAVSASAHAAKEIVMSAAIVLAILIPMEWRNGASARTHRLMASTVSLSAGPSTNPQLLIWRDRLPQIIAARKALQSDLPKLHLPLVLEVFTTSFQAAGHTYFISAVNFECSSSSLAPNTLVCPARVAEIDAGQARIVSELPELPISSARPSRIRRRSNAQQKFMTLATLDPRTGSVTFSQVYDGERNPMPQSVILK